MARRIFRTRPRGIGGFLCALMRQVQRLFLKVGLTPLICLRKLAADPSQTAVPMTQSVKTSHDRFASFADFYPYYLSEHRTPTCRRLHFIGTALVLTMLALAIALRNPWLLVAIPLVGYGFAWIGHFFFDRNRPATFKHPIYSLVGDLALFRDMLVGRIRF